MKNILFISACCISLHASANAYALQATTQQPAVPAAVAATFAKTHRGVTPKWEKEKGQYEASYSSQGKHFSETYDASGKLLESEVDIKTTELPAAALEYVKTHKAGAKIKEASKITLASGETQYEAAVAGRDLIFDASGKFIKEVKD